MDEYTFILLAKLQADRLSLERRERAARQQELFPDEPPRSLSPSAPRAAWFGRRPEWREQS